MDPIRRPKASSTDKGGVRKPTSDLHRGALGARNRFSVGYFSQIDPNLASRRAEFRLRKESADDVDSRRQRDEIGNDVAVAAVLGCIRRWDSFSTG